jgi:hypothetical protein
VHLGKTKDLSQRPYFAHLQVLHFSYNDLLQGDFWNEVPKAVVEKIVPLQEIVSYHAALAVQLLLFALRQRIF